MHDVRMAKRLQNHGFTAKAVVWTLTLQSGLDRPDSGCSRLVSKKHPAEPAATEPPIAEILSELAPEVVVTSQTLTVRVDRTVRGFGLLQIVCRYGGDALNRFAALVAARAGSRPDQLESQPGCTHLHCDLILDLAPGNRTAIDPGFVGATQILQEALVCIHFNLEVAPGNVRIGGRELKVDPAIAAEHVPAGLREFSFLAHVARPPYHRNE